LNFHFEEGEIILIDKPKNWTSFDIVKKIRILLRYYRGIQKIKVGHAGTLDPLATGLLICCTGKATRRIVEFQEMDKEYVATVELGRTTPSFDLETEANKIYPVDHITEEVVRGILTQFIGEQEQMPPAYSAKNVKGKRAYQLARAGEIFELKAKRIEIKEIKLLDISLPAFSIKVRCSRGTYVRSLVRDIGIALHSGAVMTSLKRTAIGDYKVEDALSPKKLEKFLSETEQI